MWEEGDVVYHVANPKVRGVVGVASTEYKGYVSVDFDEAVTFREGQINSDSWQCSMNLLYSTPEEAKKNHICQGNPCWNCVTRHIKDVIE